jgi:phage tail tube protein FII
MDYTMTLAVKRYLCSWMGQDQVEIQPQAGVFKIKGVDVLAGARKMLG